MTARTVDADVNRRYFVWYVQHVAAPGATVLDFGSGAGALVRMLRAAGYDAYGVDLGSWGHDPVAVDESDLPHGTLRYYNEGERLPFDDHTFDVVISNQVFEHVVPFEASADEIDRVLKPDGVSYHHFPSRVVIREGHIGIPLAHRLPPGRLRLYYTAALRWAGFGKYRDEQPTMQWAREGLDWVDRWTVYRDIREIHAVLGRRAQLKHREIDYCRFRAGDRIWLAWPLRQRLVRRPAETLFRLLAFEAIEARPFASSTRPES